MSDPDRAFVRTFLATAFAAIALWAAPIVATDAYGTFRAMGVPTSDWPTRAWTRVAAAERLIDPRCDVVLLGTSQVVFLYGVEPFEVNGLTFCNAAMGGGTMAEMEAAARLLVREGRAKRVLLFLDLLMFHDGRGYREDFAVSRMQRSRSTLTYLAWNATSWGAFVETAHAYGFESPLWARDHLDPAPHVAVHVSTKGFLHRQDLLRSFDTIDDSLDALRRTLRILSRGQREVLVALPPIHAIHHENYRTTGLWTLYGRWKREVAGVLAQADPPVRAWDFQRYHDPATSPLPFDRFADLNPWWFDAVHPSQAMGKAVLSRIGDDLYPRRASTPWDRDFGVPLTPASAEADLARREHDRTRWMVEQPTQIAVYRQLVATVLQERPELAEEWDRHAQALGQTAEPIAPASHLSQPPPPRRRR